VPSPVEMGWARSVSDQAVEESRRYRFEKRRKELVQTVYPAKAVVRIHVHVHGRGSGVVLYSAYYVFPVHGANC
jgi:hypothetical protein